MQPVQNDEHTSGVGLLTVFGSATRHTPARAQLNSPQREALHSPPEPKDFPPTGSIFAFRDRVKTSQCFTYALWETAYKKTNRAAPPGPGTPPNDTRRESQNRSFTKKRPSKLYYILAFQTRCLLDRPSHFRTSNGTISIFASEPLFIRKG